jgi:CheY-like chemotaxis protein
LSTANRVYRVLIVDDEPSALSFMARVLNEAGYETALAEHAEEALSLVAAAAAPFDLLLTDLMMPVTPGDQLAATIRRTHPDIKVLYVTGYSDRLFAERSLLWQDEAFVDKPISPTGLREAVSLSLFGHTRGLP